ncbi:MAG: hypothetical protein ACO35C_03815 [Pontimonas sp.]
MNQDDPIRRMIDPERSLTVACKYHESDIPKPASILDMARSVGGYRVDADAIRAPVIMFSETGKVRTDTLTFTLGTETRRGMIAPTKKEKERVLQHMHVSEVVMVGMTTAECLLMFPVDRSDSFCPIRPVFRHVLIALHRDGHLQRFDGSNHLYTFMVRLLNSSPERGDSITKSQSFVTKLLFKGLFHSVGHLNRPWIWAKLFQSRPRRTAETIHATVAGI